jgi:hypothetical protein
MLSLRVGPENQIILDFHARGTNQGRGIPVKFDGLNGPDKVVVRVCDGWIHAFIDKDQEIVRKFQGRVLRICEVACGSRCGSCTAPLTSEEEANKLCCMTDETTVQEYHPPARLGPARAWCNACVARETLRCQACKLLRCRDCEALSARFKVVCPQRECGMGVCAECPFIYREVGIRNVEELGEEAPGYFRCPNHHEEVLSRATAPNAVVPWVDEGDTSRGASAA